MFLILLASVCGLALLTMMLAEGCQV